MKTIIQLLFLLNTFCIIGQDGHLDTTFNPTVNLSSSVYAIAEQADGKILIGGDNFIIRLNAYGASDSSFNNVANFSGVVNDIVIHNNKIIVVGSSPSYIKRLNFDGTLDTSFNFLGGSPSGYISNVQIVGNDKILIAGDFYQINNVPQVSLARLNSDGSLDTTLDLDFAPFTTIRTMDVMPDGTFIIAGHDNQTPPNFILRKYFEDGTLDTSFSGSEDNYIYDLKIQQDGKIMICGPFNEYNNVARYGIARLNSNGTLDTTFDSYNLPQNGSTSTILSASIIDDKYIISGSFNIYNGVNSRFLAKINQDGTIDSTFNVGQGPSGVVWVTYVQNDGKVLIGGDFTTYKGIPVNQIARLNNTVLAANTSVFNNKSFLYPNPTKNTVSITIDNIQVDATAHIFALTGELLKTELLNKSKIIDLSELATGIYLITIKNGTQTFSAKIIKE